MTPCQLPYSLQDTVWGHCSTECIIKDVMSPLCWIEPDSWHLWHGLAKTEPMSQHLRGSVSSWESECLTGREHNIVTHRTAEHRDRTSGYNNCNLLSLVLIIIIIFFWWWLCLVSCHHIEKSVIFVIEGGTDTRCASSQWLSVTRNWDGF